MTECYECEQDGARKVQVKYTTGREETLELCDGCATQFESGGLVTEVVRKNSTDNHQHGPYSTYNDRIET